MEPDLSVSSVPAGSVRANVLEFLARRAKISPDSTAGKAPNVPAIKLKRPAA